MSHLKGNIDQQKGKLYQTKTVSDKNIPSGKNDLTHILHLNKLIEQSSPQDLLLFFEKEKPSQHAIKTVVNELIKKYDIKNENFYKILDILLSQGGSPNYALDFTEGDFPKNLNLEKNEEITLLMFAVIMQDIDMVKIILKYDKEIDIKNKSGKTALIYNILYNKNDETEILKLLLEHNANVNQNFKIEINPNKYEMNSIFTLACYKDFPRNLKILIDNHVDVNYQTSLNGDTGLHICAKEGKENCLKVLLNCDRINTSITNKEGKTAQELIPDNEKKNEMIKLFVKYYNNNNNDNINNINNNDQFINNINNNINNNNIDINQINNNINNLSNESSDFYEEQEIKEKINNSNSNNNINNNKNIKQQKINNNKNNINNNINNNSNHVLPHINGNIKLLNQTIYNNLLSNNYINNNNYSKSKFNIEIPIKLMPKKKGHFQSLNNFFAPKMNSTPMLNIDINDKNFKLELELNELLSQINEINKEKEKLDKNIEELDNEINQKKNKKEELMKLNEDILRESLIKEKEKNEKKKKQEDILNKIPKDKIYLESNKESKKKNELKFSLKEIQTNEMFKILNKDLLDYQKYIQEILNRQNQIINIEKKISELKNLINSITSDYDIEIYGSYAYGLNMTWSDIDLVLIKKNENQENPENNNDNIILMQQNNNNDNQSDNLSVANTDSTRESAFPLNNNNTILDKLYHIVKQRLNWVKGVKQRDNLEVRILRLECGVPYQNELKRFDIDISIENEKHNGIKCVNLIKSYLKEYNVLKPITIALRAILHSANLHLPEKGGLSAYGLILMVVSFIQSQKENFIKEEDNLCGKIFYGFLNHYGIIFDFNKYLILTYTINEPNMASSDKESYLNVNQYGQELIILDPLNNKNNVASTSFQFMNLKMAFMIAFMVTKEDCDCGCHFGEAEFENSYHTTEHCYLKRMLNSVRRFQG